MNMTDALLLASAKWDVISFIMNATNYIGKVGTVLIALLGVIMVVAAGVFASLKLFARESKLAQSTSWFIVIALLLVGGAFAGSGGFRLLMDISSGGQTTINDLGNGGGGLYMLPLFFH